MSLVARCSSGPACGEPSGRAASFQLHDAGGAARCSHLSTVFDSRTPREAIVFLLSPRGDTYTFRTALCDPMPVCSADGGLLTTVSEDLVTLIIVAMLTGMTIILSGAASIALAALSALI